MLYSSCLSNIDIQITVYIGCQYMWYQPREKLFPIYSVSINGKMIFASKKIGKMI
jgi:hypothetical protein